MRSLRWLRWQGAPAADDDAISLAMAMVALPVVLGLLGWWIDGLLGTSPVFLVALAGFGVASSFASAWYRYERRIAEHDDGKPWARSARKVALSERHAGRVSRTAASGARAARERA